MKVTPPAPWNPASAPTFWINHASRLLMREFEQELRPLGFGFAYMRVLAALEADGPLVQRDLVERARVEQPTMAALLTRMERDGAITRAPHPSDHRASLIALTDRARGSMPDAKRRIGAVVERAIAGFTDDETATLIGLLSRVVQNLDGACES